MTQAFGLVAPLTVIGLWVTTSISSGLARVKPTCGTEVGVVTSSVGVLSVVVPLVFMEEFAFQIPKAIISPNKAPARIAKNISLRIKVIANRRADTI